MTNHSVSERPDPRCLLNNVVNRVYQASCFVNLHFFEFLGQHCEVKLVSQRGGVVCGVVMSRTVRQLDYVRMYVLLFGLDGRAIFFFSVQAIQAHFAFCNTC